MVNVLIISYYFPPEGGPAVQRVAKFVKYLPKYNYCPFVLTSKHPFKVVDADLNDELNQDLKIYRVHDLASYLPGEIFKRFKSMFYPDKQAFWANLAIRKAKNIIRQNNIKLIFTSSPPHSSQLIAYKLSKVMNIPYVVDLRDEWSANPDFRSWVKPNQQRQLEHDILSKAAYVTTICNGAANRLKQICQHDRVATIFNGYDPLDYEVIECKRGLSETLTFAYGGRLSEKTSPKTFLTALKALVSSGQIDAKKIQVQIWGNNNEAKWMQDNGSLQGVVHFHPYLSHKEYIKSISQSDILLLFVTKIRESDILTGKVFEYMFFGKPILTVVEKDCELNTILSNYGNAIVNYNNDIEGIKASIIKYYMDWQQGTEFNTINQSFVNGFNRLHQASQLADVFNSVLNEN